MSQNKTAEIKTNVWKNIWKIFNFFNQKQVRGNNVSLLLALQTNPKAGH